MSEVQSLSELPYWGGGFPAEHEYSTLTQVEERNNADPDRPYDDALAAADLILQRWTNPTFRSAAGLYLHGTPGNGKTHFAIALGRALAEREIHTAYLHLPDIHPREIENRETMSGFKSLPCDDSDNAKPSCIFSNDVYSIRHESKPRGKSALILDDYRPEFQRVAFAAIEAAAERGGLVVITSNHTDPFGLLTAHEPIKTDTEIAMRVLAEREDPEAVAREDTKRAAEAAAVTASLRSRMVAMMGFVEFTGPDRRLQNSIWN